MFSVLSKRQKEIRVAERVGVRSVRESELAVDVRHHLNVIVVETRDDNLVEVDDDSVAIAVDVAHHTVVE